MAKIDEIKDILLCIDAIEFAYLFGSYARKEETKRSDIDIALYLKKENYSFDTKLQIHHLLEIKLHKEIDLVFLNKVKNFYLLENILNEGILLKDSNDDKRILYELDKEHEIKDYKAFKRLLDVA